MFLRENYDLTSHNTFRMKVRCARYVQYDSAEELVSLDFDALPKPLLHIGSGSNLLFTGDFPGTVLHSNIDFIKYIDLGLDQVSVMVGSGVVFDRFVEETCRHGLWGAENLSLIPGEVGAAAVQNIGAYGVEVKDIISGVVCFDLKERKKVKFSCAECEYGYRDSLFKKQENKGRYIVTSVLFRLSRVARPHLEYKGVKEALQGVELFSPVQVRDVVSQIRRQKLPDPQVLGSAGSFFKNPVVEGDFYRNLTSAVQAPGFELPDGRVKMSAAWLIDQCGFKGFMVGGASVYENQPLVIVNASGEASPRDVLDLEKLITERVKENFGILLHPEVEHV